MKPFSYRRIFLCTFLWSLAPAVASGILVGLLGSSEADDGIFGGLSMAFAALFYAPGRIALGIPFESLTLPRMMISVVTSSLLYGGVAVALKANELRWKIPVGAAVLVLFLGLGTIGVFLLKHNIANNHLEHQKQTDYYVEKGVATYQGRPIAEADAASFAILTNGYAKDKSNVFRFGKKMPGFDPDSFAVLKDDAITRDKNGVYYNYNKMPDADPLSFVVLSGNYAKDAKAVYWADHLMPGVDAVTFRVLSSCYAKDKDGIFSGFQRLKDVDVATFTEVPSPNPRDKRCRARDKAGDFFGYERLRPSE